MKTLLINGHEFQLHPSGAIYWPVKQTLLLADVHLGKAGHFRKNGIAVPRKVEGVFYQKIQELQDTFAIKRILFLGDLFHSVQNNEWFLFEAWAKRQTAALQLIVGNHDIIPSQKFHMLGVKTFPALEEEGFFFTHYPEEREMGFVICGHLHPGVRLQGKGKQRLQLPCFYLTPGQLILPAFGAFTGLHILTPQVEAKVYVITAKEVIEIPQKN